MVLVYRMKHKTNVMKKLNILSLLIMLCFSATQSYADHLSSQYLFAARLNGAQEVPAVNTNAVGVATFFLNNSRDTLCIKATFNGLSGAVTSSHIHEALAGSNGGVVIDLTNNINGNMLSATLTGAALTPEVIAKMLSGAYYLNVHTAANPNGEIRGQILPETDWGMMVQLTGDQQTPAVSTPASGLGFFMLSKHMDKLSFNIVLDSLSGPIADAHLHKAVMGQSGPVVLGLSPYINGNMISGSVDSIADILPALLGDSLYINVHTAANPNGEIRGQLKVMPYMYYDANMTGGQQTPPVTTMATGVAVMSMNYTFDTLWYHAMVQGLSGPIADAHFHKGAAGASGGVIAGIPSSAIMGNHIMGMLTGAQLTDSLIDYMNSGMVYINVHTVANPNGEIRGQVNRTFREGYTFTITGNQQVPAVTTAAFGSGMVSIDRNQTNAHYMMVVNGLTPTDAHFHSGAPGTSGPVIYGLGSMYQNGGIYGYWKETDMTTPFTTAFSSLFRHDSVYVNFHTAANPNGEIRGNVNRMLCQEMPITSVGNVPGNAITASLSPNPTTDGTWLQVEMTSATSMTVDLIDMTGKKVWSTVRTVGSGKTKIAIPTGSLAPGVYYVRAAYNEQVAGFKLVKE